MASVNVSTGANGSPTKCSSPNSTTTTTTTNTNPSDVIPDLDGDEDSLQKLIESEFAMRIAAVKETPPDDLLVGLQTDFFSTTQYESPSEEIPPTTDPFDPFATTVEQSPTFPGFSEEEVKEFNQDPMCGDLLSPTANTDNVLIDSITNENISTQANVDLLADLDPINDTIELSPSPPEGKNIMDEIESVEKLALIENSHPEILDNLELNEEFSRSDLKSDIKNLELSFQEQVLDPITQTIDISPSPPPENENELQNCIGSKVEEEEEDIIIPSPKIEEPMVDCINETIDLSPSPPIESTDNKKELTNGICDPVDEIISPSEEIVDPINETIDLSPSPPSDKIKDFQNQINEIEDVEKFDPINETIDLSPSPPAVDPIIADEVPEVADIIQDPMYQTYDLSPSPPVDNIAPIEEHPLNVEIVITEHEEVDTSAQLPVVDHFAPPMPTLEIDGFETWTVAGAEEEEDDAPPMQKSLLPERPTSLPHVVCADTTNTIESVGEEIVTPSSEETTSPSTETSPAKKKASKKTKSSGEVKTKKSKKTKKCEEKENISVRSSFSKFDALSRKSGVLHVRSSDSAKAQQQFSQAATVDPASQQCRCCGTQVFQMEQVKAEKAVWHKNCFRCKECNKQLTVDTYSSNEGQLYCKPHFKELFKPKAVAIEEPALLRARRPEMIIRENQPEELPPDVVRASDKPDLGLEELSALNVKSRFQVFERTEESNEIERSSSAVNVKRSPSILSKLARFQAKGMDVGVTDDSLHGIPVEESTSEEEEEEDEEGEDGEDTVVKAKVKRERPQSFAKMDDMRSLWATGQAQRREEQREERKEEVQKLRSRLFMGKCGKVKEMYEQAVQESSTTKTSSQQRAAEVRSEKARSIKERFEKGEIMVSDEEGDEDEAKKAKQEDLSVFEAGISKKSRSLFLELDSAAKSQQQSPQSQSTTPRSPLVKPEPRRVMKEENSPDRPVYHDPDIVRADDKQEEEELVRSQTASRMLSLFRQMEEKAGKEEVNEGPKPLKRFTPPPDYKKGDSEGSEEEDSEEEEEESEGEESDEERGGEPGVVRASDKVEDDFLKQAMSTNAARAKLLRAKFEQWESSNAHLNGRTREEEEEDEEREGRDCLETTSSLRARFESLSATPVQPLIGKERPKVNRFV